MEGLNPAALQYNDTILQLSLESQPPQEVLDEVRTGFSQGSSCTVCLWGGGGSGMRWGVGDADQACRACSPALPATGSEMPGEGAGGRLSAVIGTGYACALLFMAHCPHCVLQP